MWRGISVALYTFQFFLDKHFDQIKWKFLLNDGRCELAVFWLFIIFACFSKFSRHVLLPFISLLILTKTVKL